MGFFAFFGSLMIGGIVGYLAEKWDLTHNGVLPSIIIALGGGVLLFLQVVEDQPGDLEVAGADVLDGEDGVVERPEAVGDEHRHRRPQPPRQVGAVDLKRRGALQQPLVDQLSPVPRRLRRLPATRCGTSTSAIRTFTPSFLSMLF